MPKVIDFGVAKAYEYRHNWIPWMGWNPNYEPLRDDPRFQDLLRRINLPQ